MTEWPVKIVTWGREGTVKGNFLFDDPNRDIFAKVA